MGSWGYGPFQSDAAMDWLYKIEDSLDKAYEVACHTVKTTDNEHELMAAAQVIISFAPLAYYHMDVINEAKNRINGLLESGWVNEWREPEQAVEALNKLLAGLEEIDSNYSKGVLETIAEHINTTER